jgi:2,3-bisphosphoglycerate-dependent phosphoglycerate mutase
MRAASVPPVTTILLSRHGETDWNAERRWQGHADPPLNARGREQSRDLAHRLRDEQVDAVYTSDLRRAYETAAIVGAELGVDVIVDRDLREIDVGSWTGLTIAEVQAEFPEGWRERLAGGEGHDGESRETFSARVVGAVERIAAFHPGRIVLVVAHGGTMRALGRHADPDVIPPPARNCEVRRVRLRDGKLRTVN